MFCIRQKGVTRELQQHFNVSYCAPPSARRCVTRQVKARNQVEGGFAPLAEPSPGRSEPPRGIPAEGRGPCGAVRCGAVRCSAVRCVASEDNEAVAGAGAALPPLGVSLAPAFPPPRAAAVVAGGAIAPLGPAWRDGSGGLQWLWGWLSGSSPVF